MIMLGSIGSGVVSVYVASYLVANLLLVAALAKLFDLRGTAQAVEDFNLVPARLARPVALLVPFTELVLAVGLASESLRLQAAAGTAVLLTTFSFAIGLTIFKGRHINCNCFGALGTGEVGWHSLARNAFLGSGTAIILLSAVFDSDTGSAIAASQKVALWALTIPIVLMFLLATETLALGSLRSGHADREDITST